MHPLLQSAVISLGITITAFWCTHVSTRAAADNLRFAGSIGVLGAGIILLYEYIGWRRRREKASGVTGQQPARDVRKPSRLLRLVAARQEGSGSGMDFAKLVLDGSRSLLLAAVTPLLEKNAMKTLANDVPWMFSMRRLVVLAFAVGMMRQLWTVGITTWPEATLSMSVVLALPLFGALERATPEQVVDVTKTLIGRFGVGEMGSGERRSENAG